MPIQVSPYPIFQQGEIGEEIRLLLGRAKKSGETITGTIKRPDGTSATIIAGDLTEVSGLRGVYLYLLKVADLSQVGVSVAFVRGDLSGNVTIGIPLRFRVVTPDDPLVTER